MASGVQQGIEDLLDHGKFVAVDVPGYKRVFEFYKDSPDILQPGSPCCLGCPAELLTRTTVRVLGEKSVLVLPPSCIAINMIGWGAFKAAGCTAVTSLLPNGAAVAQGIKEHFVREGQESRVVVMSGDGGTADIGLQALSGAAERRANIIYICADNEGYMNTGIQRSATTPRYAWTFTTPVGEFRRGKPEPIKNVPLMMLMSGPPLWLRLP